jgi:aspartyl-tRNA(Asn)/glutamyl-tRNA(Gln) amidotransferase subunit A
MADLTSLSIHEAADALKKREITSVELTQAHLDRIAAVDDTVKAFLTLTPDLALDAARAADARRATGEEHPLLGVPVAYKGRAHDRGHRDNRRLENSKGLSPAVHCHRRRAAGSARHDHARENEPR